MANWSIETSANIPEIKETPQITPSRVVREGNEWREVKSETESSLEKLKKDILWWMKFELVKKYFDSLKDIPEENKPYILWGILSWLNQRWIAIEWFENWKIKLKTWKQSLTEKLDIADHNETIRYEELINNYLKEWVINIKDIYKALLYRTTEIDNYIQEWTDKKNLSTSDYARRLFKKYKIKISSDVAWKWLESLDFVKKEKNPVYKPKIQKKVDGKTEETPTEEFIEKIDKEWYEKLKQLINETVTDNQSDKEFLIAYIDDVYSNKRQWISENFVKEYKKSSNKIERWILWELNKLSDEQKFAIWIKDSDDAKQIAREWKNNPLEALKKAFTNGGWLLWVIFWIIGSIFWWKKWFFWWLWLGIAIGWGWPAVAWRILNEAMDWIGNWKWKKWNSTEEKPSETNSLFDKFKWKLEANSWNLNKKELAKKWEELSKNDKFLKAPASLLKIFETEKDETKIIKELKKYWIELSEENKEFYKYIFSELIKDRNENIGGYENNEQIWIYLNRTSKKIDKLASNQRLDKDWNILTWEFETKNWVEYLKNGERRNKANTKIEIFKDGKLVYTYDGKFDAENKFNGIVTYNDWTWRVDIFENWERQDYDMYYYACLAALLANDVASFTGVWTVPGAIIWWAYGISDAFTDNDAIISLLQEFKVIPEAYRGQNKVFWDRALALVGAIPLAWQWVRLATKWEKVAAFIAKLSPEKLAKFEKLKAEMLEKIKNKFSKFSKWENAWKMSEAIKKVKWVFENREIWKIFWELKEQESLKVWETEFTRLSNWRFWAKINWVEKELDIKQVLNYINTLPIEKKQEFLILTKQWKILERYVWQIRKIDWHEVEILKWWKWKIRSKDWTILNEQETADFVYKNADMLARKFRFMSISEWWVKVKEWIINWYKKYWIETFWDYLDKAWYIDWKKSKFFWEWFRKKLDFLWWIVLTPATSIRQIISAISDKEWENMFKILISWNKNAKFLWEGSVVERLQNSWLSNALTINWLINFDDDLTKVNFNGILHNIADYDDRPLDEVWDAAFYRFWWILNTIAMKYMWIID